MDAKRVKKISKYLTYVLRHKPDSIGITLSNNGWANVKELIEKSEFKMMLDFNEIKYVVDNQDSKNRLLFSEDFCKIKAQSGHSVKIELEMEEVKPPAFLYHGTLFESMNSIMKEGLTPKKRHHVNLSSDIETAKIVANRRSGKKVILKIEAMKMRANGYKVYLLNNIYFADKVNPEFISILEEYS